MSRLNRLLVTILLVAFTSASVQANPFAVRRPQDDPAVRDTPSARPGLHRQTSLLTKNSCGSTDVCCVLHDDNTADTCCFWSLRCR
jgi:hypothetical protein